MVALCRSAKGLHSHPLQVFRGTMVNFDKHKNGFLVTLVQCELLFIVHSSLFRKFSSTRRQPVGTKNFALENTFKGILFDLIYPGCTLPLPAVCWTEEKDICWFQSSEICNTVQNYMLSGPVVECPETGKSWVWSPGHSKDCENGTHYLLPCLGWTRGV